MRYRLRDVGRRFYRAWRVRDPWWLYAEVDSTSAQLRLQLQVEIGGLVGIHRFYDVFSHIRSLRRRQRQMRQDFSDVHAPIVPELS
jgi:hypothetical protein